MLSPAPVNPPEAMPAVETRNLTRRFGDVVALDRVSVTIRQGEFFSLLGPSGCGKTTLLRIIAGLDAADAGELLLDGAPVGDLPAHRRPVNTVFQSYALFPHLDVHDNVAFGLRMKKVPAPEIKRRVERIMDLVEITPLAKRRTSQLSGGQKQRVALARAIVNEPKVLLLDEPLAALDLKLRKQLQLELLDLQRRLAITFVYVTHDQEEALVLSDRIAVMRDGRIEQMGGARELYEKPHTRFVSQFLGSCTLLDATLDSTRGDSFTANTSLGRLEVAGPAPNQPRFTLAIRPEKIRLSTQAAHEPEPANTVTARIEQRIYVGSESHYHLRAGSQSLRAEAMNSQAGPAPFDQGDSVLAHLPSAALIVLDD